MAVIPNYALDLVATLSPVTLTGTADTFTYIAGTRQTLVLRNPTGASITPTLIGSAAPASYAPDGINAQNLSAGRTLSAIAAGANIAINLDRMSQYLQGNCSVTGGTGLVAFTVSE